MKIILYIGIALFAVVSLQACGGCNSSNTSNTDNNSIKININNTKPETMTLNPKLENDGVFNYENEYGTPPCPTCPSDTLLLDTTTGKYYINLMLMPNQEIATANMIPPAGSASIATDVTIDLNGSGSNTNIQFIKLYIGEGDPTPDAVVNLTVTLNGEPERKGSKSIGECKRTN